MTAAGNKQTNQTKPNQTDQESNKLKGKNPTQTTLTLYKHEQNHEKVCIGFKYPVVTEPS